MNHNTAVLLLLCLVVALVSPDAAQAGDCVPWVETMDLPDIYPEIQLNRMAVSGSLLVGTKDQVFYVYRLDGQDEPELISSVPVGQSTSWIRVLEGQVYLMPWSGTSWRVDLADLENLQLVPVTVPAGSLRDVIRFDGGYLMLMTAENAYVVEDPTASDLVIVADFEVDNPLSAVAHGSIVYLRLMDGVQPVDLSDSANPIVGSPATFNSPDGEWWMNMSCTSLVIHEGALYGSFVFMYAINHYAYFTMAFDIFDPFEPVLTASHPEVCAGQIEIMGDYVVLRTGSILKIFEAGDLEPVATIGVNAPDAQAGVAFGEDYLLAVSSSGLHRVDFRNLTTVEPMVNLPDGYDTSGCDQYGLATRRTYEYWMSGVYLRDVDWTIYDQMSITALDSLATGHIDVGFNGFEARYHSVAIADANERWVVVQARAWYEHEDDQNSFLKEDLVIVDLETGNHDEVNLEMGWGQAVLSGDILWTTSGFRENWSPDLLQAYRLTDDGVVPLGRLEFSTGDIRLHVADEVYVVGSTMITVLALSEPENLKPIREIHVDQDLVLKEPLYVEDGHLVTTTSDGLAIIELDPVSPEDSAVIGSCELEIGEPEMPPVRQGDVVIFHTNDGWQAVDLADPTMPVAASPLVETWVSGLYWSGHLLYVNTRSTTHLYDVTDLANPQWVGQSTYQPAHTYPPCALDGYVVSGTHALLPDCNDITPIESYEPDEPMLVPAAVTLAPVVPNPFNPSTTITFELHRTELVKLVVHDLRGRRLVTLLDRECPPGGHRVQWLGCDDSGRTLPSGTYLVQLRAGSVVRSTKAVLVR